MNFEFAPEPWSQPRLWVTTEDDLLKVRWAEGVTLSFIAAEVGRTRNAVAGRVHRLGLTPRAPGWPGSSNKAAKPVQKNREITIMPKRKEEPPEFKADPIKEEAYVDGTGVALLDLEPTQCRWPLNAPSRGGQYFFCGDPNVGGGLAYCRCHLKRSMSEDAFRRLRIAA